MDEERDRRGAELRALFEQGILTEDTFRAALAGLESATLQASAVGGSAAAQDNSTAQAERAALAEDVEGNIVTGDNNSVLHITTIYQQAPGEAQLDSEAFQAALGRYLHWVERRYGRLDLRGVEPREQNALSLTLDDVYVSLMASVTPKREERFRSRPIESDEDARPVDMSRLLALGPRLIITGGPGSGKTTFLRLIAATVARAIRIHQPELVRKSLGLGEPLPLPIFISLSDFNRYRRQFADAADPRQGTLMAFISHDLIHQQAVRGLPADFFERLLDGGQGVLLLLDGLDEVADERERVLVSRAVENLAFNDGVGHVIVTSRTRAYYGDAALAEEFQLANVQPMSPAQVDLLADRWCHAVYLDETTATTESSRLRETIHALEDRRKAHGEAPLVDNPLIVTIVAIVHYNEHRLPEQRAELYGKCVDVLLAEKHHQQVTEAHYELVDWGGTLAEKRKWLAYLAFRMMDAGEQAGRTVDDRTLGEWLRPRLVTSVGEDEADRKVRAFCTAMRERSSLLGERGGRYQFTHLTFQEYLSATYLADVVSEPERVVGYLAENGRLADAWWRETVLLVINYLGLRSDEQALRMLSRLATLWPADATALAAAELAASAFNELDSQDKATKDAIIIKLVTLVTDPALDAPPLLRSAAGDALGSLGDPRPGVLTLEPDLIPIPAGAFLMGDSKYSMTIEQPFAVARYPVTNAQFRYFVEDGGYSEHWYACWTQEGWDYIIREGWTEPRLWKENSFSGLNQPVVGLSWYEALAYANWLAAKTGRPYRLPTLAEWERTARHIDGREYPWNNSWQEGIANCNESKLGRTTAVGVFPASCAVCGAADLAGNVWEWCQTRWCDETGRTYAEPYRNVDGRESLSNSNRVWRMLKGGSWATRSDRLRCASRHRNDPNYRNNNFGFRVVVSPISPTADL